MHKLLKTDKFRTWKINKEKNVSYHTEVKLSKEINGEKKFAIETRKKRSKSYHFIYHLFTTQILAMQTKYKSKYFIKWVNWKGTSFTTTTQKRERAVNISKSQSNNTFLNYRESIVISIKCKISGHKKKSEHKFLSL